MNEQPRLCENCGERPGTRVFAADGTAFAHGWTQLWCDRCVIEKQIAHAEAQAARLPELEDELLDALAKESTR